MGTSLVIWLSFRTVWIGPFLCQCITDGISFNPIVYRPHALFRLLLIYRQRMSYSHYDNEQTQSEWMPFGSTNDWSMFLPAIIIPIGHKPIGKRTPDSVLSILEEPLYRDILWHSHSRLARKFSTCNVTYWQSIDMIFLVVLHFPALHLATLYC